jgi:predicted aspartyl protease
VPIEFPLRSKRTTFGWVSDPKMPVFIDTRVGRRVYQFLIDTGADFSLAPRSLASDTGLDWAGLSQGTIMGVEQGGIEARFGRLTLRVHDVNLSVRCFFLDTPKAPFVLGRADFLDCFILTIDQPKGRIVLDVVDR